MAGQGQNDPFAAYVVQEADPFAAYVVKDARARPAASTEPDTFWGGVKRSVADTASRTAKSAGRGFLRSIDPRQLPPLTMDLAGGVGGILTKPAATVIRGEAPAAMRQALEAVRALSSPEQGGEAIGQLGGLLALGRAIPSATEKVGRGLQNTATSLYERILKPNRATIDAMPRFGRTLADRSNAVARALLEQGATIDRRGADAFEAVTRGKQAQVDALVAQNPEARGSTAHLRSAIAEGRRLPSSQWAPSSDTAAYNRVAMDALKNPKIQKTQRARVDTSLEHQLGMAPGESEIRVVGTTTIPRVTAKTARELTQGTYRNMSDKAYGELQGPQVEAHKAIARGGRAIVNEAIPAAEPINNDIARRIDLGQVLDEAAFRAGKHDAISLGQHVAAAASNPHALGLSTLSRPGIGSRVAKGLFGTGQATQTIGSFYPQLIRAALLQKLAQSDEQP